jgi:hypothetical protein
MAACVEELGSEIAHYLVTGDILIPSITDLGWSSSFVSVQRHYPSWLWFVSERHP